MTPRSPQAEIQRIVLAVGLPGSGKSTWFARRGVTPLASDQVRLLLSGSEDDQSIHSEVFETLRYLLEMRLRLNRPVTAIDATNLRREHRRPFLEIARKHGCVAEAVLFETPLEICLKRNRGRRRRVPEEALYEMAGRAEPPTLAEGFARVLRVRQNKIATTSPLAPSLLGVGL